MSLLEKYNKEFVESFLIKHGYFRVYENIIDDAWTGPGIDYNKNFLFTEEAFERLIDSLHRKNKWNRYDI